MNDIGEALVAHWKGEEHFGAEERKHGLLFDCASELLCFASLSWKERYCFVRKIHWHCSLVDVKLITAKSISDASLEIIESSAKMSSNAADTSGTTEKQRMIS